MITQHKWPNSQLQILFQEHIFDINVMHETVTEKSGLIMQEYNVL